MAADSSQRHLLEELVRDGQSVLYFGPIKDGEKPFIICRVWLIKKEASDGFVYIFKQQLEINQKCIDMIR